MCLISAVITDESTGMKLRINEDEKDEEELVDSVLCFLFYNGPRFSPHSGMRVSLSGDPAIQCFQNNCFF